MRVQHSTHGNYCWTERTALRHLVSYVTIAGIAPRWCTRWDQWKTASICSSGGMLSVWGCVPVIVDRSLLCLHCRELSAAWRWIHFASTPLQPSANACASALGRSNSSSADCWCTANTATSQLWQCFHCLYCSYLHLEGAHNHYFL